MRPSSLIGLGTLFVASLVQGCGSSSGNGSDAAADAPPDGADAATCPEVWATQPVEADKNRASGVSSTSPQIGFDGAGNAIAVWEQEDGNGVFTVWGATRTPDGTWSASHQISQTPVAAGAGTTPQPALAVSANGSAIVVWQQYAGLNPTAVQHVWASRYASGTWSAEMTIEGPPITANANVVSRDPRVAMDSKGNAVATWAENRGDPGKGDGIFVNQFVASSSSWGGFVLLAAPTPVSPTMVEGSGATPQVAVDEAGDATVVWTSTVSNVGFETDAARYDGTAKSWSQGVYLDACRGGAATTCDSNQGVTPQVVMDSSRNALAIWQQQVVSANNVRPWGAYYSAKSSSWSTAQVLDANSTIAVDNPRLAVDASGNAIGVWQDSTSAIFADYFTQGAWKPVVQLDSGSTGVNRDPEVAFDDAGNAFVVWDNQSTVVSSRFQASTASFGARLVITQGNDAGAPQVAISHGACPTAIAVWQSADGQPSNESGILTLTYH